MKRRTGQRKKKRSISFKDILRKQKKMTQILIIQRSLKEIAINLPFDFLYANALSNHNERKAILKQKPIKQ